MDNKYYAYIDGNQTGPFDLEQLIDAGVRPSTYVWCKGMDDWHRADEVEAIRNLFTRHINRQRESEVREPEVERVVPEEVVPRVEQQRPRTRMGRFGVDLPPIDQIEPDFHQPPRVSMALAILSILLCFWPLGIVAVYFTYKAQKTWRGSQGDEEMMRKAHDYARLAKMWLGLSAAIGLIFWTLFLSTRF